MKASITFFCAVGTWSSVRSQWNDNRVREHTRQRNWGPMMQQPKGKAFSPEDQLCQALERRWPRCR
eukprot:scaffold118919_cov35-Tisochrysis_lutea.AAC.2